jgi:ankyrin repeat protein
MDAAGFPANVFCLFARPATPSNKVRVITFNHAPSPVDSPMHAAACAGDLAEVARLARLGRSGAALDDQGLTPLHYAVTRLDDPTRMVKALLSIGSDINAVAPKVGTALHVAVVRGNEELCRMLLQAGADLMCCDDSGYTALDIAHRDQQRGALELLRRWQHNRCQQPVDFTTPLLSAVQERNLYQVAAALECGQDPNECNGEGVPPLHTAVIHNDPEIVELLLKYKACPNATVPETLTPLYLAVFAIAKKDELDEPGNADQASPSVEDKKLDNAIDIVRLLLKYKANVNACDHRGKTALHVAVAAQAPLPFIRVLLEYGADPGLADKRGKTPVDVAHSKNCPAEILYLLRPAVDPPDVESPAGAVARGLDLSYAAARTATGSAPG